MSHVEEATDRFSKKEQTDGKSVVSVCSLKSEMVCLFLKCENCR